MMGGWTGLDSPSDCHFVHNEHLYKHLLFSFLLVYGSTMWFNVCKDVPVVAYVSS